MSGTVKPTLFLLTDLLFLSVSCPAALLLVLGNRWFLLLCGGGGFLFGFCRGFVFFCVYGLVREDVVDHVVLGEGNEVGGYPVDEEPCGESGEEDAEDYGQKAHHLLLLRGRVPYGQLLRGHRGQHVEDGEDKEVIGLGQVLEPQEAAGPEAFERVEVPDRVVQDQEDGELYKDG